MPRAALLVMILLAACASPRDRCERDALQDLRVLEDLIAESERTVARGYGLQREAYTRTGVNFCYGGGWGRHYGGAMSLCTSPEVSYRTRPVAVDMAAERAKLADLKRKRAELAPAARRRLEACRIRYPAP